MLYGHTSSNMPSRFLREIPQELVKKRQSSRVSYSYSSYGAGYDRDFLDGFEPERGEMPKQPSFKRTIPTPTPKPVAAAPNYRKGDMVLHDAFGQGMILSVLQMGKDAMLEIAFDRVGTKRLMAITASQRMKKL